MTTFAIALIAILILFVGFFLLRNLFGWSVCPLCAAVVTTWFTLLVLFHTGFAVDPLVIAIFMGGSAVGGMYALEERLPDEYHIFRLAFIVTFTTLTYVLITESMTIDLLVILVLLWAGSFTLFARRNSERLESLAERVINCCKNW